MGQPIAWCIADGASGEIVAAFLNSVNERYPETRVYVIMTDHGTSIQCVCNRYTYNSTYGICTCTCILTTDNMGWSAAREVFGNDLKHILCRWHVDRYVTCTA